MILLSGNWYHIRRRLVFVKTDIVYGVVGVENKHDQQSEPAMIARLGKIFSAHVYLAVDTGEQKYERIARLADALRGKLECEYRDRIAVENTSRN